MLALAVIESFNKFKDGQAGFGPAGNGASVDEFLFERAPEAFHGGIIVAVAFSAHGEQDLVQGQSVTKVSAGVLAAPIGMEHQLGWGLALGLGHVPSREDQGRVELLGHGPTDDSPTEAVHDAGQVPKDFALLVEVTAHELNHRSRRCLNGRTPCAVFHDDAQHLRCTKRQRQTIFRLLLAQFGAMIGKTMNGRHLNPPLRGGSQWKPGSAARV